MINKPEQLTASRFLSECLKSEEISGGKRDERISELLNWFDRYFRRNANPKWFKSHVAELCYYIMSEAELQERHKTEAEPIGYMNRFTGRVFSPDEQPGADTDTAVYMPVYTAPPAPVVPDERRDDDGSVTSDFDYGWNACRAVMLQSKYRDLSQPVDLQISEYEKIMLRAGWVIVPVEPTDEMIAAAMNCEDVIFDSKDPTAFRVQYRDIYIAMTTEAPQPEENNE